MASSGTFLAVYSWTENHPWNYYPSSRSSYVLWEALTTRYFRHSLMNVKLPANLSNLSEKPFPSVALNIRSIPRLAPLISVQIHSNCELQNAEGGQAQTFCA
jgi:hypothetical protein